MYKLENKWLSQKNKQDNLAWTASKILVQML